MVENLVNIPYLVLAIAFAIGTILLTEFLQDKILYQNKDFLSLVRNIKNIEAKI
jgi:hypothetical protein